MPFVTMELQGGGRLLIDEAFLPSGLADSYLADLRDQCAWEH
jgi:hypothetical protein